MIVMRDCRQIGQSELADETGVYRQTIYRLENDKLENQSYRLLFKIAGYFGEPDERNEKDEKANNSNNN